MGIDREGGKNGKIKYRNSNNKGKKKAANIIGIGVRVGWVKKERKMEVRWLTSVVSDSDHSYLSLY